MNSTAAETKDYALYFAKGSSLAADASLHAQVTFNATNGYYVYQFAWGKYHLR